MVPSVPRRRGSGTRSIPGGISRNESLQDEPSKCDLRHKSLGMASINHNGYSFLKVTKKKQEGAIFF